jgi:hypothetical protein
LSWLFEPAFQPFAVAGLVLLGLVLIEMLSAFAGSTLSDTIEGFSAGAAAEKSLGWLNLGRVPVLVLLMALLAAFTSIGFVMQSLLGRSIGALPPLTASLAAFAMALPATRGLSRVIGRMLPRDESYAIIDEQLVGKTGVVTVGPLESASVGRASVLDAFGNKHFPRVRPLDAAAVIEEGAAIVIVGREGREYRVVRAPADGRVAFDPIPPLGRTGNRQDT